MVKLVGAYSLRANLIRAALEDLSKGGVITLADQDPETALYEAVRRHLEDYQIVEDSANFALDLLSRSTCRLPAGWKVAEGATDFSCGSFSVKDVFEPKISYAGMSMFGGNDFLGRQYAWRSTRSTLFARGSSSSKRNEYSSSATSSVFAANERSARSTRGTSMRQSRTLSRSFSSQKTQQNQSNASLTSPLK